MSRSDFTKLRFCNQHRVKTKHQFIFMQKNGKTSTFFVYCCDCVNDSNGDIDTFGFVHSFNFSKHKHLKPKRK